MDFLTKLYSNYFDGELWPSIRLGLSILFLYASALKTRLTFENIFFELEAFSHNFKINSILVWQLKHLKQMMLSSAKFTILISWSPIYISLIFISESMNIVSNSAAMMHSNNEKGQPSRNHWIMVKESDRRQFTLILDWILV